MGIERDFDGLKINGYFSEHNYIELQFHGGVTLKDMSRIEVLRTDSNADAIKNIAE